MVLRTVKRLSNWIDSVGINEPDASPAAPHKNRLPPLGGAMWPTIRLAFNLEGSGMSSETTNAVITDTKQLRLRQGKRRYRDVPLPDGTTVRLQSLLRSERRKWRRITLKDDGSIDQMKLPYSDDVLLAMSMIDEQGNLVFSTDEALKGQFDTWDNSDTEVLITECIDLSLVPSKAGAALKNSEDLPKKDSSGN